MQPWRTEEEEVLAWAGPIVELRAEEYTSPIMNQWIAMEEDTRGWGALLEEEEVESESDGRTLSQPSVESTDGEDSNWKTLSAPSDDEQ